MIHTRTTSVVQLRVVRGSLADSLSPLLDTAPCGAELEAVAREAVDSFVQIETLIDQTAARLVDQLSTPDLFSSRVMIVNDVELVELLRLTHREPLPASVGEAVMNCERELFRQLRTLSMAVAHAAHSSLRDLGIAIEAAAPSEGRTRAIAVHEALVELAITAGMDRDVRRPFQALWPQVCACATVAERPRLLSPEPPRPWLQSVRLVDTSSASETSGAVETSPPAPTEHSEALAAAEPAPLAEQA